MLPMQRICILMILGAGALAQAKAEEAVDVPIKDLRSSVYDGSWEQLPDFSKLKPLAVEKQGKGLISLGQSGQSDNFGMVWEGTITAPKPGTFTFVIRSDDGSRLTVAGKTVVEMVGTQSEKTQVRNVKLKQGDHPIRIEYFQNGGKQVIGLAMRGPGTNGWLMLSEGSVAFPVDVSIK